MLKIVAFQGIQAGFLPGPRRSDAMRETSDPAAASALV
jgi:hypothetical protein